MAVADPPAAPEAATPASAPPAEVEPPKGSFMSSFKQAFTQDFDREVVRGHFDVGAAPDTHRYYCLVDPKTGKSEPNGVSGQLVKRADKMNGVKNTAVSFFSCADAERKGMLVTSDYVLRADVSSKIKPVAPLAVQKSATVAAPVAAAAVAAPAVVAAAAAPAVAGAAPAAAAVQMEVMATYTRFIAGQNAHDRAMVSEVLLDSKDFVWAQYHGNSIWGYQEALAAFESSWKGTWKLDPQTQDLRIASVAAGVAVLVTPVLFTEGEPGKPPATHPVRWAGVFVKTASGWRIASIFITPFDSWRTPKAY